MPAWRVSEPYINLRLEDQPLGYQPARGLPVTFQLSYRQRGSVDFDSSIFSVGTNWSCSLRAYLLDMTGTTPGLMRLHRGGAGWLDYTIGQGQLWDGSILTSTNGTNQIEYSDGRKELFQKAFTNNAGSIFYFLTAQSDPAGNTITYSYSTNTASVQLLSVTDPDGLSTAFSYGNATFTNQITRVVDPFNHTNTLKYDSGGYLTNIVDVAGLASSFTYDANNRRGWITNLNTPYGNTRFRYGGVDAESNRFDTVTNAANRFIEVTQPDGGQHLWLYRQDCTNFLSASVSPVPVTDPLPNTFDNEDSQERNSFYWGPLQHGKLSSAYLQSGDVNTLTNGDYTISRLSHWLMDLSTAEATKVLSLQQAPSPDGITAGQVTWYDYDGKLIGWPSLTSTNPAGALPSFIAQVLPDGTMRFTYSARNSRGLVTQEISTFSLADGSVAFRTNTSVYADNDIDLLSVTNYSGVRARAYGYNANHQVVADTNAVGDVTSYTYDANSRRTSIKAPSGLTTTNTYGADGQLSQSVDVEISRTNSFTWTNGQVYTHTDERGVTVTNSWDALSRLTNVAYPDGTAMRYGYSNLDLVQVTDRLGFTTKFAYDSVRNRISATDPRTNATSYTYCNCGSLDYITNALNQVTHFAYDDAGKLIQTIYPDGYNVTNSYDLPGRLTTVSDGQGTATNWYNNQGLVTAVSNALGQVQGLTYDIEDRVTNSVDGNGVAIAQTFDDLGRTLSRTYPDTGVETFAYSARGVIGYTNQLGQTNYYFYDEARRKTGEANANSQLTQFKYDASGNLTNLIDAKTNITTWKYDQFGRVTNKTDAASNVIYVYKYDANDRLTNRWTPAKTNTLYAYDAAGNLTSITYPANHSISLAYDALNRLINMVDGVGTTAYAYTSGGLLQSEDGPWANDTVNYSYNNRLRTGLNLQAPNASDWVESYGYDGAKRFTSLTSPAGAFSYGYDGIRQMQVGRLTLPNGAYITNAFDSLARLLSTTLKNSGNSTLNSHSYAYNLGSQRTNTVRADGSSVNYAYDPIGQLKTAFAAESGGTTNRWQEQLSYAYDGAGNLNYRTNHSLLETFAVNNLNELSTGTRNGRLTVGGTTTSSATNVTVNTSNAIRYADCTFVSTNQNLVNGTNTFTAIAKDNLGRLDTNTATSYLPTNVNFSYDLNGNLLSDGLRGFDYDDENQLVRVTVTNGFKSEFTYDGKMRRRIRREYAWQLGAFRLTNEVHYVYDGNLVIQERDANGLPVVAYSRGKDLSGRLQGAGGIGGLLALSQLSALTPQHAYYHADGNGNVTMLINSLQLAVAKYLYDPFGNTLSASGPLATANLYRFSSKEAHEASGLVYYLYRYYDPVLQRWLNRDPIDEYDGLNMFRFARNSPLDHIDPEGLAGCTYDGKEYSEGSIIKVPAVKVLCVRSCSGQGHGFCAYITCWNTRARGLVEGYLKCKRELDVYPHKVEYHYYWDTYGIVPGAKRPVPPPCGARCKDMGVRCYMID